MHQGFARSISVLKAPRNPVIRKLLHSLVLCTPKVLFRKLFFKKKLVILTNILQDWCSLEPTQGNVGCKPVNSHSPPRSLPWSCSGPAFIPAASNSSFIAILLLRPTSPLGSTTAISHLIFNTMAEHRCCYASPTRKVKFKEAQLLGSTVLIQHWDCLTLGCMILTNGILQEKTKTLNSARSIFRKTVECVSLQVLKTVRSAEQNCSKLPVGAEQGRKEHRHSRMVFLFQPRKSSAATSESGLSGQAAPRYSGVLLPLEFLCWVQLLIGYLPSLLLLVITAECAAGYPKYCSKTKLSGFPLSVLLSLSHCSCSCFLLGNAQSD